MQVFSIKYIRTTMVSRVRDKHSCWLKYISVNTLNAVSLTNAREGRNASAGSLRFERYLKITEENKGRRFSVDIATSMADCNSRLFWENRVEREGIMRSGTGTNICGRYDVVVAGERSARNACAKINLFHVFMHHVLLYYLAAEPRASLLVEEASIAAFWKAAESLQMGWWLAD